MVLSKFARMKKTSGQEITQIPIRRSSRVKKVNQNDSKFRSR